MDAHANFPVSTVATAPSPATSGTSLVVASGHGSRFPAVPFNAVVCDSSVFPPTPASAEIVRVTNISTDTLTITRTQESTSARTVVTGDLIYAAVTKKTLTDIEDAIAFHGCKVYNSAVQSISSGANTALTFDSEEFDTDAFHSTVSNTSRITIPSGLDGKYMLTAGGLWNSTVNTPPMFLEKNGTTNLRSAVSGPAGASGYVQLVNIVDLVATDYVEVIVFQNSGGPINFGSGSAESQAHFTATKIG